jgi:hypothetical protein
MPLKGYDLSLIIEASAHRRQAASPIVMAGLRPAIQVSALLRPTKVAIAPIATKRHVLFDDWLAGSTAVPEPLPAAETRLGRRTARTFPLRPPPQKN